MTAGAALPVDEVTLRAIVHFKVLPENLEVEHMTPERRSAFNKHIIRMCLEAEDAPEIRYGTDAEGEEAAEYEGDEDGGVSEPAVRGERVGRNEPCSCGSGKKHKKCCGKG